MIAKIHNSIPSIIFALLPVSIISGSLIINLNILIFIFFGILAIYKDELKINFSLANKCIFAFFLVMFVSTFYNQDFQFNEYTLKSIFLFRFLLIYIIFETLYKHQKINIRWFYIISSILGLIIAMDIFLHLFFDSNLFSIESDPYFGFNSLFGEEKVAGGYIFFTLPFTLVLFLKFFENNIKFNILETVLLYIFIAGIFISANKMSFIMAIFFLILCAILIKRFRKQVISSVLIFLISINFLFEKDKSLLNKYASFFIHLSSVADEKNTNIIQSEFFTKKYSSSHGLIYLDSFEVFKDKKLFGGGLKSFRQNCPKLKKEVKHCSTHPHNFVLEILNDVGILGLILSITFSFLLLRDCIYKIILNKNKIFEKTYYLILIALLFSIFWPVKSSGSIFSTFSGSFLWINLCILSSCTFKKN
jgi:O-antigen ligase